MQNIVYVGFIGAKKKACWFHPNPLAKNKAAFF